jgi:aryl-alcohol dehydrogenase-like predicted oxidoreductase
MQHIPLGQTGLMVSELCLGTMTWGNRNTEDEGHAQIDMALDHGVNFLDTAEMYPVAPIRAKTVGHTEAVIGTWLAKGGQRDRLVIATKITGEGLEAVRAGAPIDGPTLRAACEASLRRLQTDCIDLYQLHWPNRAAYHFRDNWSFDPRGPSNASIEAHMLEILQVSAELITEGKIRAIALSNESVWGAAKWLSLARAHGLPRMATVQNEYSLLCRQFDTDWAELSVLEDMPLLAFSPLATGLLTGKYQGNLTPAGSRRERVPELSGRITPRVFDAVAAYLAIARDAGIDPAQMAIAWCRTRPFPCIPIFGAVTPAQLSNALASAELTLSPEVLARIDAAHRVHPMPF